MQSPSDIKNKVVFVVGFPRSGTKLLRELLKQHPMLFALENETEFLKDIIPVFDSGENLSPQKQKSIARYMQHSDYVFYNKVERNKVIQLNKLCYETVKGFYFSVINPPDSDDRIIIDKSPGYSTLVDSLVRHFPDAQFIHVVRDPRDAIASLKENFKKDVFEGTATWHKYITTVQYFKSRYPEKVFEVSYEDIVSDPIHTMDGLFRYLGVDTGVKIKAELGKSIEPYSKSSITETKIIKRISKYTTSLSEAEINYIEEKLSGVHPDYTFEVKKNAPISIKRKSEFFNSIMFLFEIFRRHGWNGIWHKLNLIYYRKRLK